MKGKKVVIIGSGASGVEAAELSVEKGAKDVIVFARSDKWIIPRNTVIDILLSLQPFGRQMVRFCFFPLPSSLQEQERIGYGKETVGKADFSFSSWALVASIVHSRILDS